MAKRILVTGSEGFVGRYLVPFLEAQGHVVIGCDRTLSEAAPNRIVIDMNDEDSIAHTVREAGVIDAVFHLAARTFVPEAMDDPIGVMETNFHGTIRLIEAMREHAPKARLLFVSSSEVYGPPQRLPMTEEHPLAPINPYALSKAAADHYCAYASRAQQLDIVRLRPFNHTGAGQSPVFVLSSFAQQVARMEAGIAEPILRVGNLEAARDFLHVYDVVRAYTAAVERCRPGEAYNICSGESVPLQRAVDTLVSLANIEVRVEVDPRRLRPVDVPEVRGSHKKFTDATGWHPEIPLRRILKDLLEYWRREIQAGKDTVKS
jgi:GDP-4-dehydro-6-deoxy-D-mannose reductase